MHQPTPPRLAVSVQTIRNPLTRAAYGLRTGAAHLLVLQSGAAQLRSEGDLAATEAPRLAWWPDGGGSECVVEPGSRGSLISIPEILLLHGIPATPLGDHMRRTLAQRLSLVLSPDLRIAPLLDNLAQERASALPGGEVAETHILGLLLIQLWRAARADLLDHGHSPQGLAERFVQLASRHRLEHRTVADYARLLGVTRDRLGSAVRRATGLSPQGYLHRDLMREACELLANTGMQVGQVAFRLGFSDPAYFTRFFARQTGLSPARYRRRAQDRRAAGDRSYAAWP